MLQQFIYDVMIDISQCCNINFGMFQLEVSNVAEGDQRC
jgi:hypothetical protein